MERRGPYRGSPWVIKTVRMPEDPKHLDAILREVSIQVLAASHRVFGCLNREGPAMTASRIATRV